MKEFNRIWADRKKKWKKEGPGRPTKRSKTIESDEEEIYFEIAKDEPEGKILVELTPWQLSNYAEQGLEGMKEGFT